MKFIDDRVLTFLVGSLRDTITKTGHSKVVLGLSGGIDSAVVAAICAQALGVENIFTYFLSYRDSSPKSREDAQLVSTKFGLKMTEININPAVDGISYQMGKTTPLRLGNIQARVRMTMLFDQSSYHNAVVIGTSNKTELLLGYSTWFGDSACSINLLGDLYKTQVYQLAKLLDVPQEIIDKAPSADHHKDQTDEADLGYTYEEIDKLLDEHVEQKKDAAQLVEAGFDRVFVDAILDRVVKNRFKRRLPAIVNIGQRIITEDNNN